VQFDAAQTSATVTGGVGNPTTTVNNLVLDANRRRTFRIDYAGDLSYFEANKTAVSIVALDTKYKLAPSAPTVTAPALNAANFVFAAPAKVSEPVYTMVSASMTYSVATGVTAVQVRKASDNSVVSGATSTFNANGTTVTITVPFTEAESPFNFVVVALGNSAGLESTASAAQALLKQFAAPVISGAPKFAGSDIKTWQFTSMSSSSGQYHLAGSIDGLHTSSDYGMTWKSVPTNKGAPTAHFFSGHLSSSGQYQTAFSRDEPNGNNVYVSHDYGETWMLKLNCVVAYQNSVSVSSTGQYQSVNAENQRIFVSSDYGNTWTPNESVRSWQGISISSSGEYQTAVVNGGGIFRSSNWGANWSLVPTEPTSANWYSISVSSTGQYQTAVTRSETPGKGSIYISSNYGINWTVVNTAPTNHNWASISISSSGQYQTAIANSAMNAGGIYISTNHGVNWTLTGAPINVNWWANSVSSTGQYQSAAIFGSGRIYFSSDYGVTWYNEFANIVTVTYSVSSGVSAVQVRKASDNSVVSGVSASMTTGTTAAITVPFTASPLNFVAESPFNFVVVALGNSVGSESAASAPQTLTP
jgi:hypothetical protein